MLWLFCPGKGRSGKLKGLKACLYLQGERTIVITSIVFVEQEKGEPFFTCERTIECLSSSFNLRNFGKKFSSPIRLCLTIFFSSFFLRLRPSFLWPRFGTVFFLSFLYFPEVDPGTKRGFSVPMSFFT